MGAGFPPREDLKILRDLCMSTSWTTSVHRLQVIIPWPCERPAHTEVVSRFKFSKPVDFGAAAEVVSKVISTKNALDKEFHLRAQHAPRMPLQRKNEVAMTVGR